MAVLGSDNITHSATFKFNINSGDRIVIDSSGRIGMGISASATTGTTLTVGGRLNVIGSDNNALFQSATASNNIISIVTGTQTGPGSLAALELKNGSGNACRMETIENQGVFRYLVNGNLKGLLNSTGDFELYPSSGGGYRLFAGGNILSVRIDRINFTSSTFFVLNDSASVGVRLDNGNTAWASQSDERLKEDLIPIENAISKILNIRSVTGRYKSDKNNVRRSFLIAQDFEEIFPECISSDEDGFLNIRYTETIPLLVASIKEIIEKINYIDEKIETLFNKTN
jgi:hypothetical protein